jgi:NAD+ synthase/NAD+ synthase (glutamine-hydrolysing)
MKIAIAQINPIIGDFDGNAQQILAAAQLAIEQEAALMLTPELSLCGYPPRDLLLNPDFGDRMSQRLEFLAQQLPAKLTVLVGTVSPNCHFEQGEKPLFNSVALLEDGQVRQVFHKRLLPTYDVFDEARYFQAGRQANHILIQGVHVGISICEDLWNDEQFWGRRHYEIDPIAELAALNVDVIVNLSASPYTVGKPQLRENMLKHTAQRFKQAILYVNQVGGNDDLIFDGGSFSVNPDGEVIVRAKAFDTDVIVVDCVPQQRCVLPVTPAMLTRALPPDEAEIWSALVLGVRDYTRKCGFSKIVLGLSGGVDSALVAAIAVAAIGPDNVLGVLMPSPYSSEHSISDALVLAKNLGIQTQTIPIQPMMQGFDAALAPMFEGTAFGVAEENLQSRIRGNLLMAIANKFGHLLLSTGNKSEISVGYCTLYGDMNGGLAAIADVPKTKVYDLCRWLNQVIQQQRESIDDINALSSIRLPFEVPPIPAHIIAKPPSAELRPDQVDQDSLPPYEILDDILERMIELHQSTQEIVAAGYEPTIVGQVARLVKIAEFKRRQAPPGLKITDRAFGTGWRMPIAQKWRPWTQKCIHTSVSIGASNIERG